MNSPTEEDYTDALENVGTLRKRTRTPLLTSVPKPANVTKVEQPPTFLSTTFGDFRALLREQLPTVQFDKIFVDRDYEAECTINGIYGGLESLKQYETERFKFFVEDGRLIIRYIGEPPKKKGLVTTNMMFTILWILAFCLTSYFIYINQEKYMNFLK
jgi:hypothetical protein